ncbi:MAG: hypothetical protein BWY26_01641 [Elusimicrobia bacterium ADurb.Bin231]|nr:MAG: hypothetical protein BWY26_01641 [Elusimicrobia bacterium ADurb.Bin231]
MIFLITLLLIAVIAIIVSLQNAEPVTVALLAWEFDGSLALVIVVALLFGFLSCFVVTLPAIIKKNIEISRYKKKVKEAENQSVRSNAENKSA